MFTGLVEELGRVRAINRGTRSVKLAISAHTVLDGLKLGDSIAVNGTCLTVTEFNAAAFTADVMPETMDRTALAGLKSGDVVNLERALRVGDRLGGHMVSGHIDGVGTLLSKKRDDIAVVVKIAASPEVLRYIVTKGSVAIDGISLTVVETADDWFSVSLIPHTADVTTLGMKKEGDAVNLETDIIGKYVEKLLGGGAKASSPKSSMTEAFLMEHGF